MKKEMSLFYEATDLLVNDVLTAAKKFDIPMKGTKRLPTPADDFSISVEFQAIEKKK